MGTALQNLDNLVQMPMGCGEQNMVLFAPIIYVLQYLEKTELLTEEIWSRGVGFLKLGELAHPFFLDTCFGAYGWVIKTQGILVSEVSLILASHGSVL